MKQVYFVCGALRSGTSLLHLMLNNHAKLSNPGEFDFLFDKADEQLINFDLTSFERWLESHRIFLSKNLKFPKAANSYQEVLNFFIEQLQIPNKILIINIHRNFEYIVQYFPDAKYIHLIRDPRDVAKSSIGMGWAGHVYYGVDHWLATERSWNKLKKQINKSDYIDVNFEELILDPNTELNKICAFCGVDYDASMLSYYENSTYEKPDKSLIYQWKKKQLIRDVGLVESKCADLMLERGYELSGQGPVYPSLYEKSILAFKNKLYRIKFHISRYGVALYFLDKLSNLIMIPFISKYVQLKKNKIQTKFLK